MAHPLRPYHDDLRDSGIPYFAKNGTALNPEEREAIAKKRGRCLRCNVRTHEVTLLRRIAITDEHVHNGICIRCNPDRVPTAVLTEWERVHRPMVAPPTQQHHPPLRAVARAVAYTTPAGHSGGSGSSGSGLSAQHSSHMRVDKEFHHGGDQNDSGMHSSSSSGHGSSHLLVKRNSVERDPPSSGSASKILSKSNGSLLSHSASMPPVTSYPSTRVTDRRSPLPNQGSQTRLSSEDYTGGKWNDDAWQIVKSIRENRSKPEVIRLNMHRLRNMSRDDESGAIYEIMEVLSNYRNDSYTLATATGAVWGITATNDDKKIEASAAGVVRHIVDTFRNPTTKNDTDYVVWALGCLSCLGRGVENKDSIAEAGGIEAIVDMLQVHQTNAGVLEWSSRALHSIVHRYDDENDGTEQNATMEKVIRKNIACIEEEGGIAALVAAMKLHSSESVAQFWAMKLLWRLQDRTEKSSTTRVLHKIIDEDGVGACVKVLKARSTWPDLYQLAAELLCTLLEVMDGDDTSAFGSSADCIPLTVRIMGEEPSDELLQQACCRLLAMLVRGGGDAKLQVKESHGIRAVVDAMCNYSKNLILLESAASLLWSMSTVPAFFDFAHLDRALRTIDAATIRHKDAVDLLFQACGLMGNVCHASQAEKESFPMTILVRSWQTNDANLHKQANRALTHICTKLPDIVSTVLSTSSVAVLVANLSSKTFEIQVASCVALTFLAKTSDNAKFKIVSEGGLSAAATVLQEPSEPPLAEDALTLLTLLASSDQKQSNFELRGDVVQAILKLIQTEEARDTCCTALRNLILASSKLMFALDSLVHTMIGLIDSTSCSVDLRTEACNVLWALAAKHPIDSAPLLSAMFHSVIGLTGKYKGEELPYHSDLQSAAAGALSCITCCIRDTPIHFAKADIDLLIALIYVYTERDLDRVELMEKILDVVLNVSYVDESAIIQCGGIVAVIDAMVEYEQNESIQERGCAILALLSSTDNLQVNLSIAETDGIDLIVSALAVFSSNEQIQVDACKALSHLSVDQESRMLISSQGGLILVVNAMNSNRDNIDLLEGAFSALLNLSSDAEEQVLMDSNTVETVVDVMGFHLGIEKLQEKGLGVLQNISMRSSNAKRAIANARGITVVTNTIKEFMGSPSVLERAFTTMWSLAVLSDNQVHIANAGGIGLVINGMMANINSERVQKQACGCLCTLSSNSRNKTLIRENGGVDAIVFAMWAHFGSEGLQVEACRALSSLAVNVQTNEVMIASDGEINAIISAMRRFPTSAKLQEYACVALRNFLLSSDNTALINSSAEDLRALLNRAADRFPDRCYERAQQVLASLS